MLETYPSPADISAPPSYHWTPALQADYLANLAATGSVRGACAMIGMSPRAAYDLRVRRDGLAFRLGWAAAVLVARQRLEDELLERAIVGTEDHYERIPAGDGGWLVRRRRFSARAGMAMLDRLDRTVAARAPTREGAAALCIASDFAAYLAMLASDAFSADADTALVAWFAARADRPDPLATLPGLEAHMCEVAQISADSDDGEEAEGDEQDTELVGGDPYGVWYDSSSGEWRTDFPPPRDFDGDYDGEFGDYGYWRALTDAELIPILLREAREAAAAEQLRDEYFAAIAAE